MNTVSSTYFQGDRRSPTPPPKRPRTTLQAPEPLEIRRGREHPSIRLEQLLQTMAHNACAPNGSEASQWDHNIQNQYGETLLMLTARVGQTKLAQDLLNNYHCFVHTRDYQGKTALMHAAQSGHGDIINLILHNQICEHILSPQDLEKIEQGNVQLEQPLFMVGLATAPSSIGTLLLAQDHKGRTAAQLAEANGHTQLARQLHGVETMIRQSLSKEEPSASTTRSIAIQPAPNQPVTIQLASNQPIAIQLASNRPDASSSAKAQQSPPSTSPSHVRETHFRPNASPAPKASPTKGGWRKLLCLRQAPTHNTLNTLG